MTNLVLTNSEPCSPSAQADDPLAEMIRATLARREESQPLIDAAVADFKAFCRDFVWTVYTDPVTESRSFARYPDYPYLDEYTAALQRPGLLADPKCRAMLATTHPLILSLHRSINVWMRGGIWRTAIVRQNKTHAMELIERVRQTWAKLPDGLRSPLVIDNKDRLRFEGGADLMALPEEGETGRGEDWDLVILDEAAQQAHLRQNIRAFAPRSRTIVCPSTYNGDGDAFCALVDGDDYPGRRVFAMPHTIHPHRRSGTLDGDAWLALMQSKMSKTDFQIEILMRRDVYRVAGFYSADFDPTCIQPVEWDGESIITIGMDYSYLNPAAVWNYINANDQVCWLGCELRHEIALPRYCRQLFERIRDTYPKCAVRIAPDPFRGRQHHGGTDQYDEATTDIHMIMPVAEAVFGRRVLVSVNRTGWMTRKEGHKDVRRLLGLRDDKRFGMLIDPSCKLLIAGLSGAYGPPENPTPAQVDLESPDENRECIHVMDAMRYGICEFVQADRGLAFRRDRGAPKSIKSEQVAALREFAQPDRRRF